MNLKETKSTDLHEKMEVDEMELLKKELLKIELVKEEVEEMEVDENHIIPEWMRTIELSYDLSDANAASQNQKKEVVKMEVDENHTIPEWMRSMELSYDSSDANAASQNQIIEIPKPNFEALAAKPNIGVPEPIEGWLLAKIITGNIDSDDDIQLSSTPNGVRTAKFKGHKFSLESVTSSKQKAPSSRSRKKNLFESI